MLLILGILQDTATFLGILHGYWTTVRNYASILIRNFACWSHLGVLPTPPLHYWVFSSRKLIEFLRFRRSIWWLAPMCWTSWRAGEEELDEAAGGRTTTHSSPPLSSRLATPGRQRWPYPSLHGIRETPKRSPRRRATRGGTCSHVNWGTLRWTDCMIYAWNVWAFCIHCRCCNSSLYCCVVHIQEAAIVARTFRGERPKRAE